MKSVFQYHTGPIKRTYKGVEVITAHMFQYHTGPIKSQLDEELFHSPRIGVSIPHWSN